MPSSSRRINAPKADRVPGEPARRRAGDPPKPNIVPRPSSRPIPLAAMPGLPAGIKRRCGPAAEVGRSAMVLWRNPMRVASGSFDHLTASSGTEELGQVLVEIGLAGSSVPRQSHRAPDRRRSKCGKVDATAARPETGRGYLVAVGLAGHLVRQRRNATWMQRRRSTENRVTARSKAAPEEVHRAGLAEKPVRNCSTLDRRSRRRGRSASRRRPRRARA